MHPDQDAEITLGTGRILALFFGLAVLCGVFFGAGFMMGKTSPHYPALLSAASSSPVASAAGKPSARLIAGDCPNPASAPQAATEQAAVEKSLEQPAATPSLTPSSTAPTGGDTTSPSASPPATLQAASSGGYLVQVAAVSKAEDADALTSALRKKQYPVLPASAGADKLYHVLIGPFADLKSAEEMRDRLLGDGFKAIVKR